MRGKVTAPARAFSHDHRSADAAGVGRNLDEPREHALEGHIVERIGDGGPRQLSEFATTSSDTPMALLL